MGLTAVKVALSTAGALFLVAVAAGLGGFFGRQQMPSPARSQPAAYAEGCTMLCRCAFSDGGMPEFVLGVPR